jgi:hypothetical protein
LAARVTVDTLIYFSLGDILQGSRKNVERAGNRQGPAFGDFDRFLMHREQAQRRAIRFLLASNPQYIASL